MRTSSDGPFPGPKLKWRSNVIGGCIIRRPCFFGGDRPASSAFFPVHVIWPAIRARVPPDSPLFSTVNERNFNRTPRAVLLKLHVADALRYIPHGIRRGTAQELKEVGYPWAVVASAGLWNSPAFRGYVDMSADVEHGVLSLFPADSDYESDSVAL